MRRSTLLLFALPGLVLLGAPAQAQMAGGLDIAGPGMGPMAPLGAPLRTAAADVKSANPARGRSAVNQTAVAKVRGDAGFTAGFVQGQPLAGSRQPPPPLPIFNTFVDMPFIVNNFGNPVTIDMSGGAASGGVPVINAQDSAVTVNSGSGTVEQNVTSAVNVAVGDNNVAQQTVVSGGR